MADVRPDRSTTSSTRALDAYVVLEELGEEIEDEWSYVTDLERRLARPGSTRSPAHRGDEPTSPTRRAPRSIGRSTRSAGSSDPHRAIDWLSTFPQVVLIAARRAAVRFQDAARDARAVVYAGIQADPLVARAAACSPTRRRAERVLARAVMNGETTDPDALAGDVPDPVRGGRGRRRRRRDRSEAILAASLAVADRGEQVRSQVRGAIVEALTAQLLAAPGRPRAAVRRERRILFDGVRGRDPPVRRDGRARRARPRRTTASGARAGSTPTSCTSSTTRGPTPPTRTRRSRSRSSSSTPRARARSGSTRQTAPHEATGLVTLETLDELAGRRRDDRPAPPDGRRLRGAVPGPLRRGRRPTAGSGRRSLLRYAPGPRLGPLRARAASTARGTPSTA